MLKYLNYYRQINRSWIRLTILRSLTAECVALSAVLAGLGSAIRVFDWTAKKRGYLRLFEGCLNLVPEQEKYPGDNPDCPPEVTGRQAFSRALRPLPLAGLACFWIEGVMIDWRH